MITAEFRGIIYKYKRNEMAMCNAKCNEIVKKYYEKHNCPILALTPIILFLLMLLLLASCSNDAGLRGFVLLLSGQKDITSHVVHVMISQHFYCNIAIAYNENNRG